MTGQKIITYTKRYFVYILLTFFLCLFANYIYGEILFSVERQCLTVSFYVKQYIKEYGHMPLSQSDLIDKIFHDKNKVDNDPIKECQLVKFKDSLNNINIAYGIRLQDITEKRGVLYSKSSGDKLMLIEGPYSYWFGLEGLYETITLECFDLICNIKNNTNP